MYCETTFLRQTFFDNEFLSYFEPAYSADRRSREVTLFKFKLEITPTQFYW